MTVSSSVYWQLRVPTFAGFPGLDLVWMRSTLGQVGGPTFILGVLEVEVEPLGPSLVEPLRRLLDLLDFVSTSFLGPLQVQEDS